MSFKNQINKLREDATCNNIACCCLLTEIFQCSILEQTKIISIRLKFKDIISFFSVIHESNDIRRPKFNASKDMAGHGLGFGPEFVGPYRRSGELRLQFLKSIRDRECRTNVEIAGRTNIKFLKNSDTDVFLS